MKNKATFLFSVLVILAIFLAACAPATSGGQTATQAPVSGEKVITWSTIAGFYTDWAEQVAKDFEAQTGYKVNIVKMDLPTMYEKESLDMVGGTGAYDVITWNVSWKAGWVDRKSVV